MSSHFTIIIPGLQPSDNNIYATNRKTGRRHKTTAAREWETAVQIAMLEQTTHRQRSSFENHHLWIIIGAYFRLYTEKGAMHKWDVSSHQKLTVDAVCAMIDRDDRHVMVLHVAKYDLAPDEEPHTMVHVSTVDPAAMLTEP